MSYEPLGMPPDPYQRLDIKCAVCGSSINFRLGEVFQRGPSYVCKKCSKPEKPLVWFNLPWGLVLANEHEVTWAHKNRPLWISFYKHPAEDGKPGFYLYATVNPSYNRLAPWRVDHRKIGEYHTLEDAMAIVEEELQNVQ